MENTFSSSEEKFILFTRKLSLGFLIGATGILALYYFTFSTEIAIFGLALLVGSYFLCLGIVVNLLFNMRKDKGLRKSSLISILIVIISLFIATTYLFVGYWIFLQYND